jgi:hypothetical protein
VSDALGDDIGAEGEADVARAVVGQDSLDTVDAVSGEVGAGAGEERDRGGGGFVVERL